MALAALGLVGTAGSAHATLVTVPINVTPSPFGSANDIAVDSATAQYYYNGVKTDILTGYDDFGSYAGLIASTGVNGVAAIAPSLAYSSQALDMLDKYGPFTTFNGTGYVNLEFPTDQGVVFGYATFDTSSGELDSITYVVPEPSTWALLITGAGMLGLASRRRRRRLAPPPDSLRGQGAWSNAR